MTVKDQTKRSGPQIHKTHPFMNSLAHHVRFSSPFIWQVRLTLSAGSSTPSPPHNLSPTRSHIIMESSTDEEDDDTVDVDPFKLARPYPTFRATSEPPPDHDVLLPSSSSLPSSSFNEENEKVPSASSQPSNLNKASNISKSYLSKANLSKSKLSLVPVEQEYSWEWGAFPQPSPMKASFGKGGRIEGGLGGNDPLGVGSMTGSGGVSATWSKAAMSRGKGKNRMTLRQLDSRDEEDVERGGRDERDGEVGGRSQSVPPASQASPGSRKQKPLFHEYEDRDEGKVDIAEWEKRRSDLDAGNGEYGTGGRLSARKSDPTVFRVTMQRKKAEFELSIVDPTWEEGVGGSPPQDEHPGRGRKTREGSIGGVAHVPDMSGIDDFELARRFEQGKIDLSKFLADESIVNDPRLVIKWGRDQSVLFFSARHFCLISFYRYITRKDESPLMRALVIWRDAYLQRQASEDIDERPSSPLSDEDEGAKSGEEEGTSTLAESPSFHNSRAQSEPPETPGQSAKPPTSSSWVQWWSRSRRTQEKSERPSLKGTASAPSADIVRAYCFVW